MFSPASPKDAHIDMKHGFIQSIIRNQYDRDQYEKEMQEKRKKMEQDGLARTPTRERRPDRALYRPPRGGGTVAPPRATLFKLEFVDSRSGAVRREPFMEGGDLEGFCADFAKKACLDEGMEKSLYKRLQKELPTLETHESGEAAKTPALKS